MSSSSGCMSLEGRGEVHEEVVGAEKAETGCSHPEAWGSLEHTCFASLAFKDLDRLLTDPSDLTPRPPPPPNLSPVLLSTPPVLPHLRYPSPKEERKWNFQKLYLGEEKLLSQNRTHILACETEPSGGSGGSLSTLQQRSKGWLFSIAVSPPSCYLRKH